MPPSAMILTRQAIGVLFELVREVNTYKHNGGNNRFCPSSELFQLYAIDIMDIVQLKKVDG